MNDEFQSLLVRYLQAQTPARDSGQAREPTECEIERAIRTRLRAIASDIARMAPQEEDQIVSACTRLEMRRNPFEKLLSNERISAIMVNGRCGIHCISSDRRPRIFCEQDGRIIPIDEQLFASSAEVEHAIEQIGEDCGLSCTPQNPIMHASMADGSKVLATHSSISPEGPTITIVKRRRGDLTPASLVEAGACPQYAMDFLEACVRVRANILIVGDTASGKTTLLDALACFIPNEERIVAIEDPAELRFDHPNLVRLEAHRSMDSEAPAISIPRLAEAAQHMKADRIIVGEIRGSEAVAVLSAQHGRASGMLSTLRAYDAADALDRLRTMMPICQSDLSEVSAMRLIATALDLVICMKRGRSNIRRVAEITAVEGYHDGAIELAPLFAFAETEGFMPQGVEPQRIKRIIEHYDSRLYDASVFHNPGLDERA